MNTRDYKILIVDDVIQNVQLLSNLLFEKGISILIANNGRQALKIAAKKIPDLILLDISMPDMNGYQVCETLKQDKDLKNIPIIFLTAKVQTEDITRGFNAGAVDYVSKPFNTAELLTRIFTHLELKRSRDLIQAKNNELNNKNSELKTINATRDKIFSIIAHDLRAPFSNLLGLSELPIVGFNNNQLDNTENYISHIYRAAKQCFDLLENLLDWTRNQTGQIKFSPEKLLLSKIVNQVFSFTEIVANQKKYLTDK